MMQLFSACVIVSRHVGAVPYASGMHTDSWAQLEFLIMIS